MTRAKQVSRQPLNMTEYAISARFDNLQDSHRLRCVYPDKYPPVFDVPRPDSPDLKISWYTLINARA